MTYQLARTTRYDLDRGSRHTLQAEVVDEEGNPWDLSTSGSIIFALFASYTDEDPVLAKEADVVDAEGGKVKVEFFPEDTRDLIVGGYDFFLSVDDYLALQGRFGLLPGPRGGE